MPNPAEPAPPTSSAFNLPLLQTLMAVVQAGLIAVIGFALTGRVDQALKRQEANLQERTTTINNLKQMSDLLKTINSDSTDEEERGRATAQLAMFGTDAVFPMFVMAAIRSDASPKNAIAGLRLLAIDHRNEVCKVLVSAQNTPKSLNEIRRGAIDELATDLKCTKEGTKP